MSCRLSSCQILIEMALFTAKYDKFSDELGDNCNCHLFEDPPNNCG